MKIRLTFITISHTIHVAVLSLSVLLCLHASGAVAGEVSGLYEAEVPVRNQGDAERDRAISTALDDVLVKVSGRRDATAIQALETVLSHPIKLVQQFRYREMPVAENTRTPDNEVAGNAFTQLLVVSFDPQAVNQALYSAGMPVWGRARPATLVWLAIEDENKRYLLGGDGHPQIQQRIRDLAQQRGVPVLIPLLDLEDQSNLSFTDVWGNFQDVIERASARYQAEAILVGRLFHHTDGTWQARWTLYMKDDRQYWEMNADQLDNVLGSGIEGSTDILSAKFSKIITTAGSGTILISITDVDTVEDYARTIKYLRSLDTVTKLQIEEVSTSSLVVSLGIRSDPTELVQSIRFGSTLAPLPPPVTDDSGSVAGDAGTLASARTMYYRLLQ